MIVKVLNEDKTGTEQNVIAGIEWAAKNGATNINLSLGIYRPYGCGGNCELCKLVENLSRTGIFFSLAAGNDPNRLSCPHPLVGFSLKVGSVTADGSAVAGYSGPGVDFVIREPPGLRRLPSADC